MNEQTIKHSLSHWWPGLLGGWLFCVTACAQPKVVAYVPNWVDLNTFSETIEYTKLTHINLAFENPASEFGISEVEI